jgi:hypothetical protein
VPLYNPSSGGGVPTGRTISAGTGLAGGGDLSADRTLSLSPPVATITGSLSMPGEGSPGVFVKIQCNTVVVDSAGWWNTGTKRYVPQVAGRYSVSADFTGTAAGVAGGFWDLAVSRNGATGAAPATNGAYLNRQPSSATFGPDMQSCGEFIMNGTTDYIELFGGASSGTAITGSEVLNIVYIGPN